MAGRGSPEGLLPYGDANAIVPDMADDVLPMVRDVPVLAGVCGTDPFRITGNFLYQLKASASPAYRTSPRSACTTESSARTWKRPAWASGWRST